MKTVSLEELAAWVKKHEKYTWSQGRIGRGHKGDMLIKYLNFSLDTRDMRVWSVCTSGLNRVSVTDRSCGEGTILDGLERHLELDKMEEEQKRKDNIERSKREKSKRKGR